ncbi:MAG: serine/threonine phosphatase [Cyanobacteria bacterium J06636_16]
MIVCPHCQFENPTLNRFCQRCGNPLKGLRAIITRSAKTAGPTIETSHKTASLEEPYAERRLGEEAAAPTSATLADLLTAENYLDPEKRYQLRHPIENGQLLSEELELDIVDCQPATDSPVALMLVVEAQTQDDTALADRLPPLAYPYWKLQDQFFPVIPELQAAWQEQSFTVLVLEDRSTWRQLSDVWSSESAEPLELIHWFYEMVDLWESLVAFEAEPSLLNHENLLIDDDQILCLKRLLYRPSDRTYDLKDLGLLWQSLLQKSSDSRFAPLEQLAMAIGTGEVTEPEIIKERLALIADTIQGETAAEAPAEDELSSATDTDGIEVSAETGVADTAAINEPETVPIDDLLLEDMLDPIDDGEANDEADDETPSDLPTMALPMQLYQLDEAGQTHVGRQRTHNEDSFYAETDLRRIDSPDGTSLEARGLYILCDGMGGHAGGEVASTLAVNTLRDHFEIHWQANLPDEATLKEGILRANQAIFELKETDARSGSARMGTTLVMLLLLDNQAIVAHVGDSRLYAFTRQGLKQVTIDHEVGQREISRGVEPAIAYARPDAYQLTQALGPRDSDEVSPNIASIYINQDTVFLLCSDGLSDNDLLEEHAETHIEPLLRSNCNLEEGITHLIDLANEHNGHDNITAIAVRVKMRPDLEAINDSTPE